MLVTERVACAQHQTSITLDIGMYLVSSSAILNNRLFQDIDAFQAEDEVVVVSIPKGKVDLLILINVSRHSAEGGGVLQKLTSIVEQ